MVRRNWQREKKPIPETPIIIPFSNTEASSEFLRDFNGFIDYLIESANLRYLGGGIEAIDEILAHHAELYHRLADEILSLVEERAKGGMLGSKRQETGKDTEYTLSFAHSSFRLTVIGRVESSRPWTITLVEFQYEGR